jgi:hypothetical protein
MKSFGFPFSFGPSPRVGTAGRHPCALRRSPSPFVLPLLALRLTHLGSLRPLPVPLSYCSLMLHLGEEASTLTHERASRENALLKYRASLRCQLGSIRPAEQQLAFTFGHPGGSNSVWPA